MFGWNDVVCGESIRENGKYIAALPRRSLKILQRDMNGQVKVEYVFRLEMAVNRQRWPLKMQFSYSLNGIHFKAQQNAGPDEETSETVLVHD